MYSIKLKEIRTACGQTVERLAQQLDVPIGLVQKWEQGKLFPDDDQLERICRLLNITKDQLYTKDEVEEEKIFGLVGNPVAHSYAKEFHESFSDIVYDLIPLQEDEFDRFMREKKFSGINVTIPYKEKVMGYLDEIDEAAKEIGVVNTVINKNGYLKGYNVDYCGIITAFKHYSVGLTGKVVLILGGGATSKSARYACKKEGAAKILRVSRHPVEDDEISYEQASLQKDVQIVINTTPVGMSPHEDEKPPVELKDFPRLEGVMDCIYNPFRTRLLCEAKALGVTAINGLFMMIGQGIRANELFLNEKHTSIVYLETYLHLVCKDTNIVLIGLPGSGKSSVAKMLAARLHLQYVNVDEEIVKAHNQTFLDFFFHHSEQYYRDLESKTIAELSHRRGVIIVTGGGAVLREENMQVLEKNSLFVYVDRDIKKIEAFMGEKYKKEMEKRGGSLEKMYQERVSLYKKYADVEVLNEGKTEIVSLTVVDTIKGVKYSDDLL